MYLAINILGLLVFLALGWVFSRDLSGPSGWLTHVLGHG